MPAASIVNNFTEVNRLIEFVQVAEDQGAVFHLTNTDLLHMLCLGNEAANETDRISVL